MVAGVASTLNSGRAGRVLTWSFDSAPDPRWFPAVRRSAVTKLQLCRALAAPSAPARNDVDQRDEGNDDHGGNRDDGDGGGGEEHPIPFFRDLLVANLVRSGHLGE
jgi:hypothetical protein